MDSFDLGPVSKRTVREEIVTRDDRIGRADSLRKPPGPPATLRTALVVGVAKLDGVVEIVNEMPRVTAQQHAIAIPAKVCAAESRRRIAVPGGVGRDEAGNLDRNLHKTQTSPRR